MFKYIIFVFIAIGTPAENAGVLYFKWEEDLILEYLKQFEGFSEYAYKEPNNTWSIGYGTRSYEGETITKKEALRRMRKVYLKFHADIIEDYYPAISGWNAHVLAAFKYNVGSIGPNLNRAILSQDIEKIKQYMLRYNKANGKVLSGLKKRREIETSLLE